MKLVNWISTLAKSVGKGFPTYGLMGLIRLGDNTLARTIDPLTPNRANRPTYIYDRTVDTISLNQSQGLCHLWLIRSLVL